MRDGDGQISVESERRLARPGTAALRGPSDSEMDEVRTTSPRPWATSSEAPRRMGPENASAGNGSTLPPGPIGVGVPNSPASETDGFIGMLRDRANDTCAILVTAYVKVMVTAFGANTS